MRIRGIRNAFRIKIRVLRAYQGWTYENFNEFHIPHECAGQAPLAGSSVVRPCLVSFIRSHDSLVEGNWL